MLRYLVRRALLIPIVLIAVNFLGFAYARLAQQVNAASSPFIARRTTSTPLLEDYAQFAVHLFGPDAVRMPTTQNAPPVVSAVLAATANSLGLLLVAFLLSLILGLVLGLIAVRREPPGVRKWLLPISSIGMAVPSFYLGALFIAGSLALLARQGPDAQPILPLTGFGWDAHLVLPALALMLRPTVQIAKVTAGLLATETGKQYVVAAKSFGYPWRLIRWRYMLRNVIAPVVLSIAGTFRLLVAELIVVEWLFGWPGLGQLLAWGLIPPRFSDDPGAPLFLFPPAIAVLFTVLALLFLVVDFVSSLLVQVFDPRLRITDEPAPAH